MTNGYLLLDAGDGRRLEQFGEFVVDRPSPVAIESPRDPAAWPQATMRFARVGGWRVTADAPAAWRLALDGLEIELRRSAAGQVGVFPEQQLTWRWIEDRVAERTAGGAEEPRILNLFGYTGVATLVAARAGAKVAHVDASRPSVAWARRNAELSGLADRPIRWLVDDAPGFVRREGRRGAAYDGIVLDPPSYGHGGARGRDRWRLEDRLPDLLADVTALLGARPFVVVTAHTAGIEAGDLAAELAGALGVDLGRVERGRLTLRAATGVELALGVWARWAA